VIHNEVFLLIILCFLFYSFIHVGCFFFFFVLLWKGGDITVTNSKVSDSYSSGGEGGFMVATGQGCVAITGCEFKNITQKGDANNAGGNFYFMYFILLTRRWCLLCE
jgi:hypothetical protein